MSQNRIVTDLLFNLNETANPGDPQISITEELVNEIVTNFETEINEFEACELTADEFQQLLIEYLKPE